MECTFLRKNGFGWQEAWGMDPLERSSVFYSLLRQEGYEINWETGAWKMPK